MNVWKQLDCVAELCVYILPNISKMYKTSPLLLELFICRETTDDMLESRRKMSKLD